MTEDVDQDAEALDEAFRAEDGLVVAIRDPGVAKEVEIEDVTEAAAASEASDDAAALAAPITLARLTAKLSRPSPPHASDLLLEHGRLHPPNISLPVPVAIVSEQ